MKWTNRKTIYSFIAKLLIVVLILPSLYFSDGFALSTLAAPDAAEEVTENSTENPTVDVDAENPADEENLADAEILTEEEPPAVVINNTASGNEQYPKYPVEYFYDQQFRWQQMVKADGDYTWGSNLTVDGYYGGTGAPRYVTDPTQGAAIYIFNDYYEENVDLMYIVWDNASASSPYYSILSFDNDLFGYTSIESTSRPADSWFDGKPCGVDYVFESAEDYAIYLQFKPTANGRVYAYYKASRQPIPVSSISIEFPEEEKKMDYGSTVWVEAEVEPYNASNKNLVWESLNSSILSVYSEPGDYSNWCEVTAVGVGETLVRAAATDGSGVKGIIHIKVNPPVSPIPKLVKNNNSISVFWDAVSGVSKYRLYRKIGTGNWNSGVIVNGTSYEDLNVAEGNEYTYLLRCVSADGKSLVSAFDSSKAATILFGNPVSPVPNLAKKDNGIEITWDAQPGVSKYRIYKKIVNGTTGWDKGVVVTGNSYLDTNVTLGYEYSYVIRCVSSDGKSLISPFDSSKARTILYANPVSPIPNLKMSVVAAGVDISWDAQPGVNKYRIYRKTSTTNWTTVAIVNGTSYTDTTVTLGNEYTYLLRCVSSDGKSIISEYDATKARTILYANPVSPIPSLKMVSGNTSGVEISWTAEPGVKKYRIYKKTATEGWTTVAVVSGTSYVDGNVVLGTEYTYLLRCVSSDGKSLISPFDSSKARSILYAEVTSPKPMLTASGNDVEIDWTPQPGVSKYRIYRKTALSNWITVAITGGRHYTDEDVERGVEYTYLMRCVSSDGKSLISAYDESKKATITIPECKHLATRFEPDESSKTGTGQYTKLNKVCDECKDVLASYDCQPFNRYYVSLEDGTIKTLYGYFDEDMAYSVWQATNSHRAQNGVASLSYNTDCQVASDYRAVEVAASFSHTRPHGDPFSSMSYYWSHDYHVAENIARGQTGVAAVMNSWKNSDGHNRNMLNSDFGGMSVGVFHEINLDSGIPVERISWTQNFTKAVYK